MTHTLNCVLPINFDNFNEPWLCYIAKDHVIFISVVYLHQFCRCISSISITNNIKMIEALQYKDASSNLPSFLDNPTLLVSSCIHQEPLINIMAISWCKWDTCHDLPTSITHKSLFPSMHCTHTMSTFTSWSIAS